MSQTVKRATEIIEFVAETPRTLNQVAAHFGVHRTTVFRQLQTLEQAGFLRHRADGTYDIGPALISIAQQALENFDLRRIAHDELRALHGRVGHTVHLAQLLENKVVYIDKVEAVDGVRMYSRVGRTVRPNCTGVGKVILAQLSPVQRDKILAGADWTEHTPATHTTRESLDQELQEIRERGWGVDAGEFENFVNCIAAPISNSTRTIEGAISVTSLKVISDLDDLQKHLPDLLRTCRNISESLG